MSRSKSTWVQWFEEKKTAAYAITEYRGGSDVLGMETRAHRQGDEWVINGTKAYITNAQYAELIIVCAMTDPSKRGERWHSICG
jgi:alkylation response protein AidB-like acyl-CoA dehydrogenase